MLRLGYKASAEQFGPRQLLDLAIAAERHGFESVWTSDHFQPWRHTDGHAPNALAWLGAAATSTSRVTLGTSVLTPTLRYNPAVVAQAFATLGCLAPGRIILGVGTGESLNEIVVGAAWPEQKERFHRLKESVLLMQRLFREDFVSFEGDYYQTHDATLYDRPEHAGAHLHRWLGPGRRPSCGAHRRRLRRHLRQGQLSSTRSSSCRPWPRASGSASGPTGPRVAEVPRVTQRLQGGDGPVVCFERMIEMKVSFDTDRARAMADTRIWAALALTGEQKVGVEDPREMERLAKTVEDVAHRRWLVSDDPEEHVEQIRPYLEWGFDHLVFHFPGDDQERAMALYAQHVLPRLRARFGT